MGFVCTYMYIGQDARANVYIHRFSARNISVRIHPAHDAYVHIHNSHTQVAIRNRRSYFLDQISRAYTHIHNSHTLIHTGDDSEPTELLLTRSLDTAKVQSSNCRFTDMYYIYVHLK